MCKQNLISSSAHTVRTVHNRKVGLTAFDTNRWLCEDTIHTHSQRQRDTVANPVELENDSFIVGCIAQAGVYGLHGPTSTDLSGDSFSANSGWDSDSSCDSGDSDWSGYSS